MKQFGKSIFNSGGFRQSIIVTGGNYIGTVISAVALIIFSRYLGPESFGVFSAAFSLTLFLARILDFGLSMPMQRQIAKEIDRDNQGSTHNLIQAVAIIKLGICIAVAVIGWVVAPYIATTILHIDDPAIVRVALVAIGVTIGFDYILNVFQALHKFTTSSVLMIVQATIKMVVALVLIGFSAQTALRALLVYTLAPSVGVVYGIVALKKYLIVPVKETISDLKVITPIAKWNSIAILAAAVVEHIDILISKATLTDYQTGLYAAAGRIAIFISLVGLSLGTVLSVRVARYHKPTHLKKYIKKAILLSVGVTLLTLCVIPFGRIGILLSVGEAYLPAVMPLTLLLVATALTNAIAPFVALFYVFDKTQYYPISGVITIVVLVITDLLLIPEFGIVGAGWAKIITRLAVLIFTLAYTKYAYNHHLKTYYQKQS